jgi:hypothetical protein
MLALNISLYYANCSRIESNLHQLVAKKTCLNGSRIRHRGEIIERKRFYRRVTINIWNLSGQCTLKSLNTIDEAENERLRKKNRARFRAKT